MLKKQLILKDPLSFLGYETKETEKKGAFGAVTSRAGVGKTAFLVQIAISGLLKDKNILHISIQDPVEKVNVWYKEIFSSMTTGYDEKQSKQLWESLLTRRFIMTFEMESFDLSTLAQRIDELRDQNIFHPHLLIIDGLSTDSDLHEPLSTLKEYSEKTNLTVWFSVRTHRHQSDDPVAVLKQYDTDNLSLFNMVIQLLPHKDIIQVKRLSLDNENREEHPQLLIDPSTMMIKESSKK